MDNREEETFNSDFLRNVSDSEVYQQTDGSVILKSSKIVIVMYMYV